MMAVPDFAILLSAKAPAYRLPPDLLVKARALSHLEALLYFGGTAWQLMVLFLLLRGRAGAAVAGWARRLTERSGGGLFAERPFLEGLLVAPVWLVLSAVIALPLELIGHAAALRFRLSIEPWSGWWLDWFKGEVLTLLVGTAVVSLLFVLLRRSPRRWWLWFWVIVQPCIVLGVYLAPVVVDPLFNHFTPLAQQDPALVSRLEQVARMGGLDIPPQRMFVEDASRRSTGMNAYVTGIGDSKRIVVWDTTVKQLPTDEILAIYAHEQGHYVLHHIPKGIAFSAALTLMLFALIGWLYPWLVGRYGDAWHIGEPWDWAGLPLVLLLSLALNFLSAPVSNAFSRSEEHAADVYGEHLLAKVLPDASQVEVQDFNRLGRVWLDDPAPNHFVVWWTYSHPPTADRAEEAAHMGRK
jgi:Zn-dependent protease with chaperone function